YDVRNPSSPAVVGKVYRGAPTDLQVRKFAHQFADEIIAKLSGGLPGVAGTQIAFVSSRSGPKEIWVMDYDGSNQRQLTNLKSIALTPRWSPDVSRIAFTCFAPSTGLTSAQICMYSMDSGKLVSFPRFHGTNITPAWSPDGTQIIFSSSMQGNPELYVSDINGGRPKRLTNANGPSISPTWHPKTRPTIPFLSGPRRTLSTATGNHPRTQRVAQVVGEVKVFLEPARPADASNQCTVLFFGALLKQSTFTFSRKPRQAFLRHV